MNPLTVQEKQSQVIIIEGWLEEKGPTQIGKELRLQKQTIANIVDNFVRRGNSEAEKGRNNTRLARSDDVNVLIVSWNLEQVDRTTNNNNKQPLICTHNL